MDRILLDLYALGLRDVEAFCATVPEARWAEQPAGLRNHPAWTVMHLSVSLDHGLELLGEARRAPAGWREAADTGTTPIADRAAYPTAWHVVAGFRACHAALDAAARRATPDVLRRPNPSDELRPLLPTVGHEVAYYLSGHTDHHLGQLVAWRRAAGLAA